MGNFLQALLGLSGPALGTIGALGKNPKLAALSNWLPLLAQLGQRGLPTGIGGPLGRGTTPPISGGMPDIFSILMGQPVGGKQTLGGTSVPGGGRAPWYMMS